jgi:4-aminobutyrate aminotransferase
MKTGHLAPVWTRFTDLDVVRGDGAHVWTADGTRYLDFTGGIAVTSTGHCHPRVVDAVREQAGRFLHAQVNAYRHDLLQPLADRLASIMPGELDTVFLTNSGAEAVEGAVKLAKQVTGRPNVIVFAGGFHGRTHLTMAMTTSRVGFRAGHAPLPSGIVVAPFAHDDRDADDALAAFDALLVTQTAPSETAAIVIEPVLGEGGYVPASHRFLEGLFERCRLHGMLFIADEIQSGMGRTGRWLALDHYELVPDVVVLGKGIASGLPLAAVVTTEAIAARWPVGSHGGTYGGNPVTCAAALATIDVLDAALANVAARGEQLSCALSRLADKDDGIADVRGLGLMIGVEFRDPARVARVIERCRVDSHVLLLGAGTRGEVVRWMPPLVVDRDDVDEAIDAFAFALEATR